MINFNGVYIAESAIVKIAPTRTDRASHPYRLEVSTMDGYKTCVEYMDEKVRDDELKRLVSQVDGAGINLPTDDMIRYIQKRQRRLQKQLIKEVEADGSRV